MASGDFLDLSEHACRAAQLDPSDTSGDLTQAKAKVNEGYLSCVHDGSPWDFLEKEGQFDLTASSDKYTYSSIATAMSVSGASIREIVKLTNDTEGYVLKETSWEHLEQLTYSTKESAEGTGAPAYWAKWGSQGAPTIRLYPNPDSAYRLGAFCYLEPAALSDNTDTPLIPLAWRHRILVPYAAARLLEQEGGTEALSQANVYQNRYDEAMAMFRTARATAKRPTFNVIQPGYFERRDGDWGPAW